MRYAKFELELCKQMIEVLSSHQKDLMGDDASWLPYLIYKEIGWDYANKIDDWLIFCQESDYIDSAIENVLQLDIDDEESIENLGLEVEGNAILTAAADYIIDSCNLYDFPLEDEFDFIIAKERLNDFIEYEYVNFIEC